MLSERMAQHSTLVRARHASGADGGPSNFNEVLGFGRTHRAIKRRPVWPGPDFGQSNLLCPVTRPICSLLFLDRTGGRVRRW
jgi:hypothetical protein